MTVSPTARHEADRICAAGVTADSLSRTEKTRAVLVREAAAREHAQQLAREGSDLPGAGSAGSGGGGDSGALGHAKNADKSRRRAAKTAGATERVSGVGGGYATTGGYPPAFLRTLDLKLSVQRCLGGARLARAAELAARTTQFNTATPRPRAEVRATLEALVATAAGGEVWTMTAVDRFGDHGVVGLSLPSHSDRPPAFASHHHAHHHSHHGSSGRRSGCLCWTGRPAACCWSQLAAGCWRWRLAPQHL